MAITQEQANQIASAYQSGANPQELANQYGVTQSDIDTYFPGFDTSGISLNSQTPASQSTVQSSSPTFTQQSGSTLTPGQAQQIGRAHV